MNERLTILPQPPLTHTLNKASGGKPKTSPSSFDKALAQQIDNTVGFSRHAQDRMTKRGINFSDSDLQRLNGAVDQVQAKGGRDSLVLMDNTALVVSIKNRQVVTVMDQAQLQDNVFTNIDSAIIA